MASDSGHPLAKKPLPTPADAPYQIPSRGDSRQSSRAAWYSPWPSTSFTQPHARTDSSGHAGGDTKDETNDDKTGIMDPRRFTPNLHASLVSEILSLRREIESKNSTLETLEESLHSSRVDNGQLEATVASQEREIRSVKKQMQLLESGTLSALGDLARERDDAVANLADVYKRLEVSKSDSRNHEEAARRDQAMWEQDKHNWDRERRNMERKVHVAEGRLKTMVHEVAAVQANTQLASTAGSDNEEGVGEPWFSNWSDIISTRSSSVRGRYHLSELSNNTYDTNELANLRNSVVPARLSMSGTEPNNLNLADELNFEEAADEHDLRHALLEEDVYKPRRPSVQSPDHKARKLLGLAIDSTEQTVDRAPLTERGSATLLPLQTDKRMTSTAQDAGMQFSPPMPPKPAVHEVEVVPEKDAYRNANTENTANQRRKRVSVAAASQESFPPQLEPLSRPSTASIACQTVLQPTSPRLVPMIALEPIFPEPSTISRPEMVSSSAQTDDEKQTASEVTGTMKLFPSIAVPVIAIHPPNSRPGTAYNDAMLPPRTQNASCQTETPTLASSNSVAVQTDGIWVDKRPLKIPPRRISAAASTKPHAQHGQHAGLPSSKGRRSELQSPPPVESLGPRARPSITQTKDSHMTKLRDQLRNRGQTSNPTSPTKSNNPFSGLSNQEGSEKEIDFSDDDDFASVAPIRKTLSKVQNSWKLVPAPTSASLGSRATGRPISDIQEVDDTVDTGLSGIQAGAAKDSVAPSACQLGPDEKVDISMKAPQLSDVRKAALISSRALAHSRKRSSSETGPSAASTTVPPPFPVPTRSSSRKIRISSSEGNRSPTPYSTSFIAGIRNRGKGPPASKNPLRKVRSAAAVPKVARSNIKQDEADSPTVTSPASTPLGSPGLPRILRSESSPQQSSALSRELEQAASSSGFAAPEPATESPGQTTSVIDAIAQTMVGEWMWKYVRKRKSFGIAETARAEFDEGRSNGESSSGIRHKRWVWLAPYERVVLWSSKQPTNGTALLGKGGRKLTIQSVLDVGDDTPMPKNARIGSIFNRSILILTPQRALKFTAPSRERHYIWLTALSFLSHSTLGMEELTAIPAIPQADYQPPPSQVAGAGRSPHGSISVAIPKEMLTLQPRKYTAPPRTVPRKAGMEGHGYYGANASVSDAAEPPQIPRVSAHSRKRSNTGLRRPSLQSAFNSFPANMGMASLYSAKDATSRDVAMSVTGRSQSSSSGPTTMRHMSETAIGQPKSVSVRNDFFDAVGTVRMEAFVDRAKPEPVEPGKGKLLPRSSYRIRQGRKKDMSYWGIMGESSNAGVLLPTSHGAWRADDPFRGF